MKKSSVLLLSITIIAILLFAFKKQSNKPVLEFLEVLNEQQLKKVRLPFDDVSRSSWHFLPPSMWERQGLRLKDLDKKQSTAYARMLRKFLSETGYNKTQKIIELEAVLAEIEGDPVYRDPENYFIAIYGNPKKDSLWGWSFEGHHISLNFTVLHDEIAASPRFFGANPAKITHGDRVGERTLDQEEDLAYELMNMLTKSQKETAIFRKTAYKEIITLNLTTVNPLEAVGIPATDLSTSQKSKLKQLITVYLSTLPPHLAHERKNKIFAEEFSKIRFGWAGSITRGKPHYYRIQGKTFLIELDNTQNNANHIHSVWRDFDGDFGKDLIKAHYQHSNHHR